METVSYLTSKQTWNAYNAKFKNVLKIGIITKDDYLPVKFIQKKKRRMKRSLPGRVFFTVLLILGSK